MVSIILALHIYLINSEVEDQHHGCLLLLTDFKMSIYSKILTFVEEDGFFFFLKKSPLFKHHHSFWQCHLLPENCGI